jgi:hypothetical protein
MLSPSASSLRLRVIWERKSEHPRYAWIPGEEEKGIEMQKIRGVMYRKGRGN